MLVSVVVLKERLIKAAQAEVAPLFEESLYLIDLELQDKGKAELQQEIFAQLAAEELVYENEQGELIQWRLYKIIDLYEGINGVSAHSLPNEVYSRHLALPLGTQRAEVLAQFYGGYVWQDQGE